MIASCAGAWARTAGCRAQGRGRGEEPARNRMTGKGWKRRRGGLLLTPTPSSHRHAKPPPRSSYPGPYPAPEPYRDSAGTTIPVNGVPRVRTYRNIEPARGTIISRFRKKHSTPKERYS
eukprot:4011884-Pleurochrysis_carterae.AAC.1